MPLGPGKDWERERERERDRESDLETIRAMAENARIELAVMSALLNKLNETLFGKERPGLIDRMNSQMDGLRKRIDKHDKIVWIGLGIVVAMNFLSGNGIISLRNLLGK